MLDSFRPCAFAPSSTSLRNLSSGPGEQALQRRIVEGMPARRLSSHPAVPTRAPKPADSRARPAGWSCPRGQACATARTSPGGVRGTDLVDYSQTSHTFVPEPVHLTRADGDAFS